MDILDNMDETFTKKVYRTIVLTWALAMIWALALGKPWIGLSITLGMLLGTALLITLDYTIRKVFIPGAHKPSKTLYKIAIIKYPLVCLMLYLLIRWDRINIPAFCGGIVLVHFAILAKLVGIKIKERQTRHKISASATKGKEI